MHHLNRDAVQLVFKQHIAFSLHHLGLLFFFGYSHLYRKCHVQVFSHLSREYQISHAELVGSRMVLICIKLTSLGKLVPIGVVGVTFYPAVETAV